MAHAISKRCNAAARFNRDRLRGPRPKGRSTTLRFAKAAAIASRKYFIKQFIDSRRSHEVSNDIQDAFACLGSDQSPERLFDLMLAKDEVWRRQDALTMSAHLVAAQIAVSVLA